MYQIVELAGGVLETAADNYLNLAQSVTDGQKIDVPTQEESEKLEVMQEESASQYININTANEETLTTLPGIGASKAKSIISYRESKGGFTSIEELMEIEGIKEGVYNKVKDMITVN
jgi:competence protein ComEA